MHYFKRNWPECRGDQFDDWGTSTWYIETDDDLWSTRQIEVYANGRILRYDAEHWHDEYGMLGDQALDAQEFASYAIPREEFEQVWNSLNDG